MSLDAALNSMLVIIYVDGGVPGTRTPKPHLAADRLAICSNTIMGALRILMLAENNRIELSSATNQWNSFQDCLPTMGSIFRNFG